MMTLLRQLVLIVALPLTAGLCGAAEVDFNRDIQPVLAERCFKCHGPDENTLEAGLRLDQRAAAIAELDSGERAIVPGDPDASALLQRVSESDPDLRMPPASEGDPLTPKQIEALRQWIAAGAEYQRHWSFVPPERPTIPDAQSIRDGSREWSQNPIDRFVLARLQEDGVQPSPEADRATLLRRVSLDLTGLPPTLEEADAFVADTAPGAYERVVDRLLASPAYGERWARVWLDLARYADSAGYADDPPRVIWEYRDWVIDALNANMPFDRFTIEQLAGDLLQNPSEEQLIATAFHRNTMTNSEGGTDDEEFRSAAVVDRVNTTLQVWMGLTMGCAQCHTHKYDPISQTDYYRVYAILNQTEDADRRDEAPVLSRFTEQQEAEKAKLSQQLETLRADLQAETEKQSADVPAVNPAAAPQMARFVRIELPGDKQMLSLAEVQVFAGGENLAPKGKATQSSTAFGGAAGRAIDGNTDGHYFEANSTTHTNAEVNPWWEVDLGSEQAIEMVAIWNRTDSAGIGARLNGCRILLLDADRQPRWAHEVATAPQVDASFDVPQSVEALADADRALLAQYRAVTSPEIQRLRQRIEQAEKRLAAIKPVTTPILRELPEDQQRKTHIQMRGNFLDLGPEVEPGVLSQFHPLKLKEAERPGGRVSSEADGPARVAQGLPDGQTPPPDETERIDRRALADWLLADDNPLTARVIVNRHWEQLFGIGLVDTSEDFGLQGNLPSHPDLLDWLAVEFREGGWDMKHLVRLIVTSATYRQASSVSAELAARDPDNRLLARGPRFRLPAERIRDQALAIGGLLSRKMHGPSVYPPRPNLGLRAAFGGSTDWEMSKGEDAHRRGLYTFWQRSIPYPSMDTFDAPSREVCTLRRINTNTPLQALVTLNDPVYVEAAQGLARRVLREAASDDESRAAYAFRLCLIRSPAASEQAALLQVLQQARMAFESDSSAAEKLATDPMGPLPAGIDPVEAAAWTVVGNVLLNLDETLARP